MPRPNKIKEPTTTYNFNISKRAYKHLQWMAHEQTKFRGEQVSVADIIRDAVDEYLFMHDRLDNWLDEYEGSNF